jgi:hypothetical protein
MGSILESIAKYSRTRRPDAAAADSGAAAADTGRLAGGGPSRGPCQPVLDAPVGKRRSETLRRVERRPDPADWSADELLALHEAVALQWPDGPVTVSTLRTAIAKGQLGYARIAGRIYTTRGALEAMAECRKMRAADGGASVSDEDWDAHLKTLLPKRGSGSR